MTCHIALAHERISTRRRPEHKRHFAPREYHDDVAALGRRLPAAGVQHAHLPRQRPEASAVRFELHGRHRPAKLLLVTAAAVPGRGGRRTEEVPNGDVIAV